MCISVLVRGRFEKSAVSADGFEESDGGESRRVREEEEEGRWVEVEETI